jgi:hypothetical protein
MLRWNGPTSAADYRNKLAVHVRTCYRPPDRSASIIPVYALRLNWHTDIRLQWVRIRVVRIHSSDKSHKCNVYDTHRTYQVCRSARVTVIGRRNTHCYALLRLATPYYALLRPNRRPRPLHDSPTRKPRAGFKTAGPINAVHTHPC